MLAGSPLGATEAIMLAYGFANAMLDALVRDRLATAEQREMRAGVSGGLRDLRRQRIGDRADIGARAPASPRPQSHQRVTSPLFSFELSARRSRLSD
jgi:hypothetical protein